jgi:DNA-binding CsgD family transcriptional regulator
MRSISFAARDRLHQRISSLGDAGLEPTELLEAIRSIIAQAIDYDAGYLACTDPATTIFSTAIVLDSYDPSLCAPTLDNEFMVDDFNKFVDMHRRRMPASTLADATCDRLHRSDRHRTVNAPAGHEHELRAVFALDGACWGVLHLVRNTGEPNFDADELDFVDQITPTVAAVIRQSVASSPPLDEDPHITPAVILMTPDLTATSMTDRAAALADQLGHARVETGSGVPLPGEAYIVGARARARAEGHDGPDPIARVRGKSGWLTVRAECTRDDDGTIDHIALVIEPARTSEVLPLFVAAHGLSDREKDVLAELVDGRSTAQIAHVLFISTHTVRDHIKSIFAKVGVSSRGELVSELYRLHYEPRLDVLHLD